MPKVLDIVRLVFAVVLIGVTVYLLSQSFEYLEKGVPTNTAEQEKFVNVIVSMMFKVFYVILAAGWVRKYFTTRDIPLTKRNANYITPVIKCVVVCLFLGLKGVPLAAYWAIDFVEAIIKEIFVRKEKKLMAASGNSSGETDLKNTENRCKQCGDYIDYRYARFCAHCGAKVEYKE